MFRACEKRATSASQKRGSKIWKLEVALLHRGNSLIGINDFQELMNNHLQLYDNFHYNRSFSCNQNAIYALSVFLQTGSGFYEWH